MLVINLSESMRKMCHTLKTKTFTVWTHQTCYLMVRQRLCVKFTTGHTESKFCGQENSGALASILLAAKHNHIEEATRERASTLQDCQDKMKLGTNILKLCHYKEQVRATSTNADSNTDQNANYNCICLGFCWVFC